MGTNVYSRTLHPTKHGGIHSKLISYPSSYSLLTEQLKTLSETTSVPLSSTLYGSLSETHLLSHVPGMDISSPPPLPVRTRRETFGSLYHTSRSSLGSRLQHRVSDTLSVNTLPSQLWPSEADSFSAKNNTTTTTTSQHLSLLRNVKSHLVHSCRELTGLVRKAFRIARPNHTTTSTSTRTDCEPLIVPTAQAPSTEPDATSGRQIEAGVTITITITSTSAPDASEAPVASARTSGAEEAAASSSTTSGTGAEEPELTPTPTLPDDPTSVSNLLRIPDPNLTMFTSEMQTELVSEGFCTAAATAAAAAAAANEELYETSSPGDGYEPSISFADLLDLVEHTDFSKTLQLPHRVAAPPRAELPPPRRFRTRALCRWLVRQRQTCAPNGSGEPPSRRHSASGSLTDAESNGRRRSAACGSSPRRRAASLDEAGLRAFCSDEKQSSPSSLARTRHAGRAALATSDEQDDNYEYVREDVLRADGKRAHRANASSEGEYLELELESPRSARFSFVSGGQRPLPYADESGDSSEYESVNSTWAALRLGARAHLRVCCWLLLS